MTVRESEKKVYNSLDKFKSFYFDAGPGSGKTYTLEKAIEHIISRNSNLSVRNQKILCITYTNAAKDEIIERLGKNSEVLISTIHDFLWDFISPQTTLLRNEHKNKIIEEIKNIQKELAQNKVYPKIVKFKPLVCSSEFKIFFYKNYFQNADEFRKNLKNFQNATLLLPYLSNVQKFKNCVNLIINEDKLCKTLKEINEGKSKPVFYDPTKNRDQLSRYRISHDTLLEYSENIIENNNVLKRVFSDRYPYVLIDEYQDTNKKVVDLLNSILKYSGRKHNFVIGFFGDSKQNIYDQGIGTLPKELDLNAIQEQENRRSCKPIVKVINKIRNDDLKQISDKENGICQFYVTNNKDNIDSFSDNFNLDGSNAYLFLKNSTIAEVNGYKELCEMLKCFSHFSNANYDNLNNEFFQRNLQNMGWFLREILNLISFKKKIDNPNTTVKEIEFYITTKVNITFGDFQSFLLQAKEIEKTDITLRKYINSLFKINGAIKGREIIYNIFSLEKDINEIKMQACKYLYDNNQETEDSDVSEKIDNFFNIKLSQFENWYDYVYRKDEGENITYYTLHGSKGLEFDDVVVVLQDDFARRKDFFKFFFKNYDKAKEIEKEDENNKERMHYVQARNLLYVACSRARKDLYVVYKTNNISEIKENIENIFGDVHYLDIKKV